MKQNLKKIIIISITFFIFGCGSKSNKELLLGKWVSEKQSMQTVVFTENQAYFAIAPDHRKEYNWTFLNDTIFLSWKDKDVNNQFKLLVLRIDDRELEIAEENLFSGGFGKVRKLERSN